MLLFTIKALTGCVVDVPTLDGRLISIPINDIVKWVFYLHFFPIWYIYHAHMDR